MPDYLIIFTLALVLSMLLTLLLSRIFLKNKLLICAGIPLSGGPAIGISFVICIVLASCILPLLRDKLAAIAVAGLAMLFFGVIDDLRELSVGRKLLAQSACAIYLIICGVRTDIMYLGFWGNACISYIWFLGLTNAFNLLDILDGLAAGLVLIVSAALFCIGYFSADINVQVLSLILFSSALGFLIFNFPPAKAYLGNSGSHFLGLLIGSCALVAHYASENNAFALLSPILILGLPIMDTLALIIFRIMRKKIPFHKSKDHIVFKIKALGFSPRRVLLIMYLLCAILCACGVALTRVNNLAAAGIIAAVCVLMIVSFFKLIKIEVAD